MVDLYLFCGYSIYMKRPGRPRKPVGSTKSLTVEVRLSELEKQGFQEAAEIAGVGLSTWIRERLRRAAVRELEEAGRVAPFIGNIVGG